MSNIIQLHAPLSRDVISGLRIGDIVELTGFVYTARDAAHKRISMCLKQGQEPPVDFNGKVIFYAGPCPTKPGRTMGSIAPTTSLRMDSFVEMMFQLGMTAMIGKGERSEYVPALCKKYCGAYLLSIGGASAMISNQFKTCEIVAYEDLGTESIKKLYVEKLRLVVGIDSQGEVFQSREIEKYRKCST